MFRGLKVDLMVGQGGLSGSLNPANLTPDMLVSALNCSFAEGTIAKEGGTSLYNSSALTGTPNILGGFDWHPDSSSQRMIIAASDGKLYRDTGGGTFSTTLKSGLTLNTGDIVTMIDSGAEDAAANKKLFIFTGQNPVQVLSGDGVATADIATPPTDWSGANQPWVGCAHEGRVWGAGNANDPHRVYYSTPDDHEDFTGSGSGSISVYPGEGEEIIAMASYKSAVVVWKYPRGVYYIDTSDATPSNWRVVPVSRSVGGASHQCWAMVDNDILFTDPMGSIHRMSALEQYGDLGVGSESFKNYIGRWLHDHVNLGQMKLARMLWYSSRRELHISFPSVGATSCTRRLVLDYNDPGKDFRARWCDRDTLEGFWVREDTNGVLRPCYGGTDGYVYDMDKDTKAHKGTDAYSVEIETPAMDLSHIQPELGPLNKNLRFLEVVAEGENVGSVINVDVKVDGETKCTVQFNLGATGSTLGAFVLGTDVLATGGVLTKRKRITGSGRRIAFRVYNNTAAQDMGLVKLTMYFLPAGENLFP